MVTRLLLLLGVLFLAACGNIRSAPVPVLPENQNQLPAFPLSGVTATFVVAVPTSATNAKSVSIAANGGVAIVHNLGSTVPGCTPPSGTTPLTCSVPVGAKTGANTFLLKTFNGSNGTGSPLASANILQSLSASAMIPVTLAGAPASISLAFLNAAPRQCNPATNISLFVAVKDAASQIIVTSSYGLTISLHDSDATGTTALSTSTLTSSATAVTLAYNGDLLKTATISASAPGILPANIHDATLTPSQMLYVLDLANRAIDVFPPTASGNVAPTRRLKMTGPDNGLNENTLVSNCTMVASDSGSLLTGVFSFNGRSNGTVSPLREITGPKTNLLALGVAVSPLTGMIYSPISVAATPGIGIWPATANGNVAPSSSIIGTKTMISNPASLAFDSSGKLYVLAFRNILVFAKGATGNVAPVQNLSTGFFCPDGVAVDSAGQIYVSDNCTSQVKVWAAGATGNASPLRTITLPSGGGANGVGADYAKNSFIADTYLSTVYSFGPTANGKVPPRTTLSGPNTTLFEPNYVSL